MVVLGVHASPISSSKYTTASVLPSDHSQAALLPIAASVLLPTSRLTTQLLVHRIGIQGAIGVTHVNYETAR